MTYLKPDERRLRETSGKKRKRRCVWLPHLLKSVMLFVSFVGAIFRILSGIQRMLGD